ncbi:MAG: hypothetical protein QNK03_14790 [Myxococcota bacterium]|nr:hypothetical protein [Myxococcota bacterium]
MRRIALLLAFALAPVAAHAQLVDGVAQVALSANGAPAGFGAEPGPSGLACAGAVPCP